MRRMSRRGFALPMTLFLIAIITLLLTAAFSKVQADRRVGESSGASVAALAIAKSSLQKYLGTTTTRPVDGDSSRVNVTGGYADVIAKVVRRPADTLANWLYVVRSVGYVIDPTQGADPQATRTIAQFAQWQTGRMTMLAALTMVNGLRNAGSEYVEVDGHDISGLGVPDTAGIRVPAGGYPSGFSWSPSGSPTYITSGSFAQLAATTNVDWNALINGGFKPDYTSIQLGDATYSSQLVVGNATIDENVGTGLLIVTGDLTFTGSSFAAWYGIVLVGGKINFNSPYNLVYGAIVSGLNEQLNTTIYQGSINNGSAILTASSGTFSSADKWKMVAVAGAGLSGGTLSTYIKTYTSSSQVTLESTASTTVSGANFTKATSTRGDIGNQQTFLYYYASTVQSTLERLTGFAPITNGWVDNWAMY